MAEGMLILGTPILTSEYYSIAAMATGYKQVYHTDRLRAASFSTAQRFADDDL